MAKKQRFTLTASSIGSYFGVGFNSPDQQLKYDTGQEEQVFDKEAQKRLDLGNFLEDGALDYFEKQLGQTIGDRNIKVIEKLDGSLRTKIDGRIRINKDTTILGKDFKKGDEIVVENKISNASSYVFTQSKGYLLQCQCYLIEDKAENVLLCGLHQGKPIMTLVEKDEQTQQDIKDMVDYITQVLMGLDDFDNYPMEILNRYAQEKVMLDPIEIPNEEVPKLEKYLSLKEKEKQIKDELSALTEEFKNTYDEGMFENDDLTFKVSKRKGRVSFDKAALAQDYLDIDLNKYNKEGSPYVVINCTRKKK